MATGIVEDHIARARILEKKANELDDEARKLRREAALLRFGAEYATKRVLRSY